MYIFTKGCIVQKAIKVPLECIHYLISILFSFGMSMDNVYWGVFLTSTVPVVFIFFNVA